MIRRLIFAIIAVACVASATHAMDSVSSEGTWPTSWPKELEGLRKQAISVVGGTDCRIHHEITFDQRDAFEAAWPFILALKSKGAPLIILRSPDPNMSRALESGVRVWPAVRSAPKSEVATPRNPNASNMRARWANCTFIELVVDGKVVDLNRISLPADTPIIDRRFDVKKRIDK
ncbi:hypothetical protein [Lacipirellula parvula]|uniref:hypothetical protein n=1 Tax=Lacipirellula parvula TaxID=2650471 RepID=UPI001260CC65|nr:hypothetical protein [Lacipirellula parvula]